MDVKPKKKGAWPKGVSGNPRGKPAGTRDAISRELLLDMAYAWEKYGVKALREMAANDPSSFVKTFCALLPKEVKVDATENMTDEQLISRIRDLGAELGLEGTLLTPGGSKPRETAH